MKKKMGLGLGLKINIEAADKSDIDEIMRIERGSFNSPWTRKLFENDFDNEFSHIYVARKARNGKICGYICYSSLFEEMHILNLAIAKSSRRKGVATALITFCLDLVRKKGVRFALLEVRESHKAARALYEKNGFFNIARRKKYYSDNGEDAIIMINHLKEVQ